MADLIYTRDNVTQRGTLATFAVYTKADWSDVAWEPQTDLLCDFVEHTIQGQIGRAQIKQHYGHITSDWGSKTASFGYTATPPLNLLNHWVKIEYTPPRIQTASPATLTNVRDGQVVYNTTAARLERWRGGAWIPATDLSATYTWYGVITIQKDVYHGADSSSGDRMWTAMSLEYLLSKVQIMESKVEVSNTSTADPTSTPRGIPFNGGRSDGRSTVNNLIGNRGHKTQYTISPPTGYASREIFQFARSLKLFDNSGNPDTATHSAIRWTIAEMLDYLLYWYPPTDANGPSWIVKQNDATGTKMDDFLATYDNLDIVSDGRTLLDIINQLLSRQRGLAWWIEVDDVAGEIYIVVDSYTQTDVPLADTNVLPANAKQYYLDWSFTRDQRDGHVYITDSVKSHDNVVVMGAPFGSVFTLSVASGDLTEDWSSADRVAYDDAYSTVNPTAYNSMDPSRRKSVNDAMRNSEALRHVYSRYKISESWDGTSSTLDPVFPNWTNYDDVPDPATATATPGLWLQGRRIHNFIPLRERWDYTTTTPTDNNPSGTVGDYLRPIVVGKLNVTAGTADTWTHLDRAHAEAAEDEMLFNTEGPSFSCTITPHAEQPGLTLMGSPVPHVIGPISKTWDGAGGNEAVSDKTKSQCDPDTILATIYMTHDKRVQQSAGTGGTKHNQASTLYIRLGERAHYDVMCPFTTLGISDDRTDRVWSDLINYTILRDDRKLLQDIATAAAEWYAEERNAIELTHQQVIGDYLIGSLITSIEVKRFGASVVDEFGVGIVGEDGAVLMGADEENLAVNSLVSHVRHTFAEPQGTSVKTQFAEMDFKALA